MSIRTVRLDDDDEATLTVLRQRTGLSISEVLKRGLYAYAAAERETVVEYPYEIYRRLELGAGGNAVGSAARAKAAAAEAIRKKHGR